MNAYFKRSILFPLHKQWHLTEKRLQVLHQDLNVKNVALYSTSYFLRGIKRKPQLNEEVERGLPLSVIMFRGI